MLCILAMHTLGSAKHAKARSSTNIPGLCMQNLRLVRTRHDAGVYVGSEVERVEPVAQGPLLHLQERLNPFK